MSLGNLDSLVLTFFVLYKPTIKSFLYPVALKMFFFKYEKYLKKN